MIQNLPKIQFTDSGNFFLIAGPCAIENEETPFAIAEELVKITNDLKIPFVFKGSFRKANRSRIDSFTGIGDEKALKIIQKIGKTFNVPTTTDIHESSDAALAAKYVDVLQIPAFLVRQTDLVVAAAKTGKAVTLKKGQFLSPESMQFPVQKVTDSGNQNVAIIERGTTFGYQDLVVDFRGIPVMQQYAPVILDITHSLQQPNQLSGVTGGKPALIETIAKSGIATGVNGIFIETHPNPSQAKSDGANMLPLGQMRNLLEKLIKIREAINS
ncbi:3-deoxy-8-phosphooctulonate synthase [Ornithobacterium rhinotracheale]|uniref:3-deoxy-8-phosphooctulonate synthase n=1 Tax=Ornithobacterium rhinotracheale TaxID=28251 RepID=A0A410JSF3_ORNRH|nr:3-deoxy-8-phosphooctulonate synthase [Ornithobacterium rhinotracheale]QAR31059.1 3-deoxy-8-phosphooctulonate synthase [Ornithobacterium rhinotracheale]